MTRLVAFTGPAGAGKSTAAQALVDTGWRRVKFADPLKNMLRQFYRDCGLEHAEIEERIEGSLKESRDWTLMGATPRHAMQTLGTEWGRGCVAGGLWVHAWEQRVKALLMDGVDVVTDDCRFDNEADAVRRLGGRVARIVGRGGIEGAHASENGVAEVDLVIHNTAAQDHFANGVRYIFDA